MCQLLTALRGSKMRTRLRGNRRATALPSFAIASLWCKLPCAECAQAKPRVFRSSPQFACQFMRTAPPSRSICPPSSPPSSFRPLVLAVCHGVWDVCEAQCSFVCRCAVQTPGAPAPTTFGKGMARLVDGNFLPHKSHLHPTVWKLRTVDFTVKSLPFGKSFS